MIISVPFLKTYALKTFKLYARLTNSIKLKLIYRQILLATDSKHTLIQMYKIYLASTITHFIITRL